MMALNYLPTIKNPEYSIRLTLKPENILLNRNFILLFSGKIISQLWDKIYVFALSWYILDFTKSPLQMAVFLTLANFILAIIAPFGGIIADRLNRKKIMIWMDIFRGIIVLIMAILLYNQLLQTWIIYISVVMLYFCGAIFSPAASSIIPNIVEENQLTQAQSFDQLIYNLCMMVGMLMGGILYNFIGVFMIFIFNATSYFISGFLEFYVEIPVLQKKENNKKRKLLSEIQNTLYELKSGFQYLKQNKIVYNLTLLNAAINFFAFPIIMVFTPYFFNVILEATSFQLSLSQTGAWLGVISGSLILTLSFSRFKLRKSIFWGLLICTIALFIEVPVFIPQFRFQFSIWEITAFLAIMKFIVGFAIIFFTIPIFVAFQKNIIDQFRGRFWGLEFAIQTLALSAGYFIAGLIVQKVWLGFLNIIIGLCIMAINLWIINVKEIKAGQSC